MGKVVAGMCSGFWSVVAIAGAVLMVISMNTAAESDEMHPEQDFIQFSSRCTVTSLERSTRERTLNREIQGAPGSHRRMKVCEDIISLRFTPPDSSQSHEATTQTQQRCDVGECKCDESAETWNGAFILRESYHCWKPSGDRSVVPSGYSCPNDACYKLFDPAEDKASLEGQGQSLTSVAGVLLGMGLLCMMVCCTAFACSKGEQSSPGQQ